MLVSLCCLKIEIDCEMNASGDIVDPSAGAVSAEHPNNPRMIRENRGKREPRQIRIENYGRSDSDPTGAGSSGSSSSFDKGILPPNSREATPADDDDDGADGGAAGNDTGSTENKTFFSGNPFVEVTKGIIHMYKKNNQVQITEGLSRSLCLFSVPATLNCHDILNFVSPCHPVLQHIRIIRDGTPNQFMVLLEFRSVDSAMEFYQTFNGAAYNNLEPDSLCHAVWVSRVDWGHDGQPPDGHTELPTCPVCLERMDESVDGILTILCNHAFHANCLIKWCDSTCPVCRCVQTPELAESSVCMECEDTEGLWICLICGHVGCGRYQGGHAATHFRATNHTYALQLGSNRVWDYAGDNFVHRLLQSKSDGKLVATESPGGTNAEESSEKLEGIQLEFTYLLTSQLDAQRKFYETKLVGVEQQMAQQMETLAVEQAELRRRSAECEERCAELAKEKGSIEKKHAHLHTKITQLIKDLSDERQICKALQTNQSSWLTKYNELESKFQLYKDAKDSEIAELKEEIRDLMFYMEAQNTIAKSDIKQEYIDSAVSLPSPNEAPVTPTAQKNRKKKK